MITRLEMQKFTQRFPEGHFGYGGGAHFEVSGGVPRLRITDSRRYDCASSAGSLVDFLTARGIQASLCRAFVKTVPLGAEIQGEDDFGSITHVFVKTTLDEESRYLGVTPLDRRVLKIFPAARMTPAKLELFTADGIQAVAADDPDTGGFLPLQAGRQHPLEWFLHHGNLVYVFAGLVPQTAEHSLLFLATAVVFEPDLPKSLGFYVTVPAKKLPALQAGLARRNAPTESLFLSAGASDVDFPLCLAAEYDALRPRCLDLLRNLILGSRVSPNTID